MKHNSVLNMSLSLQNYDMKHVWKCIKANLCSILQFNTFPDRNLGSHLHCRSTALFNTWLRWHVLRFLHLTTSTIKFWYHFDFWFGWTLHIINADFFMILQFFNTHAYPTKKEVLHIPAKATNIATGMSKNRTHSYITCVLATSRIQPHRHCFPTTFHYFPHASASRNRDWKKRVDALWKFCCSQV